MVGIEAFEVRRNVLSEPGARRADNNVDLRGDSPTLAGAGSQVFSFCALFQS